MIVRRFKPADLLRIRLQPEQSYLAEQIIRPEYGLALAQCQEAYTVFDADGPVACLGVFEYHPHRVELWALLSGKMMRPITRAAIGWLAQTQYRRIEATVAAGFDIGHKWAALLGFEQEGPEREAYMPDGSPGVTYVRVQNGSNSDHDDDLGGGGRCRQDQRRRASQFRGACEGGYAAQAGGGNAPADHRPRGTATH